MRPCLHAGNLALLLDLLPSACQTGTPAAVLFSSAGYTSPSYAAHVMQIAAPAVQMPAPAIAVAHRLRPAAVARHSRHTSDKVADGMLVACLVADDSLYTCFHLPFVIPNGLQGLGSWPGTDACH